MVQVLALTSVVNLETSGGYIFVLSYCIHYLCGEKFEDKLCTTVQTRCIIYSFFNVRAEFHI